MLFNSLHFLAFFPIVILIYFCLPDRSRWVLLLAASYYFYMAWEPVYVLLLMISTLTAYLTGLRMADFADGVMRKAYLVLSVTANLGLLFAFKYFNFFNDSLRTVSGALHLPVHLPYLKLLLPIGISFYTFKTLTYTIDIYRGKIDAQRHLGIFALYVSFFPQLVAGPIERASNLLPQFFIRHPFSHDRVVAGLKLMLWGFFLKLVIADRVGHIVDLVYNNARVFAGPHFFSATYLFTLQIYCDFSSYSLIAIGAARVMGLGVMDNFRRPYLSGSVREFWRRWHISLSTWFRDYMYIPLGGNRVTRSRRYINLLFVFLVSGLWHGAAWTFVLWGLLHGVYLVFAIATGPLRESMTRAVGLARVPAVHRSVKVLVTLNLVAFAWIFFRANSFEDAVFIVSHLFSGWGGGGTPRMLVFQLAGVLSIMVSLVLLEGIQAVPETGWWNRWWSRSPAALRWAAFVLFVLLILLFGEFEEKQFIYSQF